MRSLSISLLSTLAIASHSDDQGDRDALTAFGKAMDYKNWVKKAKNWLDDTKSVCDWAGVTCTNGRVTTLALHSYGLKGTLPAEMSQLTELDTLDLHAGRPTPYEATCDLHNFNNASMAPLYGLKKLRDVNLEYTCVAGTLDGIDGMESLESFQVHGNYIGGTMPEAMGKLTKLQILKLGRNPITGTVPAYTTLPNLVKFNCNFCAITGQFPDIFGHMPNLEQSFWDGNGLTGTLPPSLGSAPKLLRISFNINSLSGPIPPEICNAPFGQDGGDCRIGSDTDLDAYEANYPWMLPVKGNFYDCGAGIPPCALPGGPCNTTEMYPSAAQNYSLIECADQSASTLVV